MSLLSKLLSALGGQAEAIVLGKQQDHSGHMYVQYEKNAFRNKMLCLQHLLAMLNGALWFGLTCTYLVFHVAYIKCFRCDRWTDMLE